MTETRAAQLTYRQSSTDTCRVSFDGVEIGSISKRFQHSTGKEHWHWAIGHKSPITLQNRDGAASAPS